MVTRFQCCSCERLAPAASFRMEGSELVLVCARCGAESTLERAASAPAAAPVPLPMPAVPALAPVPAPLPFAEPPPLAASNVVPLRSVADPVALAKEAADAADPFDIPPDRCPKCIGAKAKDALSCPHCGLVYVNFRREDAAPSAELAELLRAALANWGEPARHERILALAQARGELPAAGRFYRLRLAAAPADPVALRGRDEVLRIASAVPALSRTAAPDEKRTSRWKSLLVAMMLLFSVGLALAMFRQLSLR